MRISSKLKAVLFNTLVLVFASLHAIGQSNCNCKPQIDIVFDDCVTRSKPVDIGFYVYDSPLTNHTNDSWVKVYLGTELVMDKEAKFSEKGFFSDVFNVAPSQDTKLTVEFYCEKNKCHTSHTELLKTLPDYSIISKDISCFGSLNGEVQLMPNLDTEMSLVWESGDRKNLVTNMHYGTYNVTIENVNGCKDFKQIILEEPKPIEINPKSITVNDGNSLIHYLQLEVTGGTGNYSYDWDHDGTGDMDDKSSVRYNIDETHSVMVMDQNGCWAQQDFSFNEGNIIDFSSKAVTLVADQYVGTNLFKYNLNKSLNPDFGDVDGDGLTGSVYNVAFYKDENMSSKINPADLESFQSKPDEFVFAQMVNDNAINVQAIMLAPDALQYCLQISEACDNDALVELIPVTCAQASIPLGTGGTYTAFKLDGTPENHRIIGPNNLGKYFFDPTAGSGSYVINYLLNGVEYEALFDIQAINPQFRPSNLPICGNDASFVLRANPRGGTLSGPGNIISFFDVGTNRFFVIDTIGLDINVPYTFYYNYTQDNQSGLTCSKEAQTTVTILNFPMVSINQFDSQVCEKEEIRLLSTASSTDGNPNLTYTWSLIRPGRPDSLLGDMSSVIIPEASSSGSYVVEVTQSNGCSNRDTGIIEVISLPKVSSQVLTDANCFGVSSAVVDVSVQGVLDYTGYRFDWLGKATGEIRSGRLQSNLPADTFLIFVTTPPLNNSGLMCSITDTVVIKSHPPIGIVCSPKDTTIACFGSMNINRTISVSPLAVGPFGYSLNSLSGPFHTSNTFTGLGVGNNPAILSRAFSVYVRDGNGCIDSCSFTIMQPQQLTCSIQKTDLTCFQNGSGTATANVLGGTSPYRYAWSNGATNGPTSNTSSTITGLSAGVYSLTVTDANNCITMCSITINQPSAISPNVNPANVCLDFDTQVFAAPTGGTGTFNYNWTLTNAGSTMATNINLIGTTNDAVQDFSTWCLKPGIVTLGVEIRDQNNCLTTAATTIDMKSCFDLAIRKRVALPNKQYYPGDTVTFNIEVFNQGTINATNVRISDILDVNMQYNVSQNTSALTGNDNNWTAGINDSLHTVINRINAGQKVNLKVILSIKPNTESMFMVNTVLISSKQSEVPFGASFRTKDNPIDEDEILPPLNNPPSKLPEKDDEICDSMNASLFPNECSLGDDMDDEDGEDFAVVSICQLNGSSIARSECVPPSMRVQGKQINTPEFKNEMDPTGNGDGIINNGDNGNLVASFHNTYLDAMKGTNPITGKIIFHNGNGAVNSSNGVVTLQGDLNVYTNQLVRIFGQLVATDDCVGVSVVELDFTPQPTLIASPDNVIAILDQEDVCFNVAIDNSLGIPLTLQWQQSINNIFVDIPGATGSEFCLDKVIADDDRRQFRVISFDSTDVARTCATLSASAIIELEGDPILACNDLVNISLDHTCEAFITPDMVLEDVRFESRISLRIVDSQNRVVPNPITSAYIGQVLTVYAFDIVNGNSCWSTIKIEDKLPPVITCPDDYTVSCMNNNFVVPTPFFVDVCDPTATLQLISDVLTELECGRLDSIIAVRELRYIAKDKYGNTSAPCTFKVYYKSVNINRVVWPANVELTCRVAPTYPVWDFNRNGKPDPSETGIPQIGGLDLAFASSVDLISNNYCRINVTYHDSTLPLCGNTYKVIRDWSMVDWCNGIILKHTQLIAVKDTEGPVVTCPIDQNFEIFTQDHSCTADFTVPAPIVISDCNTTTWTVAYLLADANGSAPLNGQYITDNVVKNGSNYIITGLPLGRTWLRYTVTDECDNFTYCFTEVTVLDKIKPTPICDEVTVVTLSVNGKALIYAETFDDGSHDNCSAVTFSVRRLTSGCNSNGSTDENSNPFGPFVAFCCSDVGVDVMVELSVKDLSGNENSCMVITNVQDKVPPVITCPSNVTITCGADTSVNVLGKPIFSASPINVPYFSDNCADVTLSWKNSGTISECGQGIITRTFTATDKAGNKAECTQRITVRNNTPYNGPVLYVAPSPYANGVTWKNLEPRSMTGCMNADINPSNTGEPELGNNACSAVAKTFEDQIIPFVDGVCFKILRKWTVIDWCKFAPNTDVNGALYPSSPVLGFNMWTFTQTIAVSENDAPVLQNCSKGDTETFADNCAAQVALTNSASDCTPSDKLRWTYTIDVANDGIGPFITGTTSNASGSFPVGTHKIIWTVEDMCGNQSTCNYVFRVIDRKKPTPYCISEITTVIMPTLGQVELWAKDYDKGSFDNCPLAGCGLKFTFDGFKPPVTINEVLFDKDGIIVAAWPTTNATLLEAYANGVYQRWVPATCSSAKLFTCDDLGSNEEKMSVWDASGNTDFCSVTLFVQANGTSCVGSRIAGNIGTENSRMVSDVIVILKNLVSQEFIATKTDVNGYFEFEAVTPGTSYTVIPDKDVDHTNGISTLDVVMIQRHILGINELDSPYKFKAADINNDQKITAADLVELRKLILGVYAKFPKNTSWRFVDKAIDINDFANVYAANEYVRLDTIHQSYMQNNFVAVKIGDVNGSATTNAKSNDTENRKAEKLSLVTIDQSYQKGETVRVPITADNFKEMFGAQWTFNFDASKLSYSTIEAGAMKVSAENMNVKDGHIAFSWNTFDATTFSDNDVLFTLEFEANANGSIANSITLSSDITRSEAYTHNLEAMNVELIIRERNSNEFALGQNNPNPFASSTTIYFSLPEDGDATLTIFDITGKTLKTISGSFVKGKNEVILSADEFDAQAVMFYELESNGQKATKKMIYLHK